MFADEEQKLAMFGIVLLLKSRIFGLFNTSVSAKVAFHSPGNVQIENLIPTP